MHFSGVPSDHVDVHPTSQPTSGTGGGHSRHHHHRGRRSGSSDGSSSSKASLKKSKSMEFLKAKLLMPNKRKQSGETAGSSSIASVSGVGTPSSGTEEMCNNNLSKNKRNAPTNPTTQPTGSSGNGGKKQSISCIQLISNNPTTGSVGEGEKSNKKDAYDWRQDTPFWNNSPVRRGAGGVPSNPPGGKRSAAVPGSGGIVPLTKNGGGVEVVGPWQNLHLPPASATPGQGRSHHGPARSRYGI